MRSLLEFPNVGVLDDDDGDRDMGNSEFDIDISNLSRWPYWMNNWR